MNNTEKILAEFDEKFVKKQDILGDEKIIYGENTPNIAEVKSFISTSITQSIAEERARVNNKIEEYFDGLIVVSLPQSTKDNLLFFLDKPLPDNKQL